MEQSSSVESVQEPVWEDFWNVMTQMENRGDEIKHFEYKYHSHPEELDLREIEAEINGLVDEGYCRVRQGDLKIEKIKETGVEDEESAETYKAVLDAEIDINNTGSEREVEPDWVERRILEYSVSWPEGYPDPDLFGTDKCSEVAATGQVLLE